MTLTTRAYFAQSMRELIRSRIADLKDKLSFGGGVADYAAYKEIVGQIRGLEESLELLDEADEKASAQERGK